MATWQCVQNCGACCHLDPSDRPDLDTYLPPDDLAHYLSLVGVDGWCINYDRVERRCNIYDDRPWFCRVQLSTFQAMFDIEADELNDFAIDCCRDQIAGVYGPRSPEMQQFDRAVGYLILPE
jgi:Fe-S-cluster containining protein